MLFVFLLSFYSFSPLFLLLLKLIVKVNGWITYFNTLVSSVSMVTVCHMLVFCLMQSLMFLGLIPFGAGVVSQFVDGVSSFLYLNFIFLFLPPSPSLPSFLPPSPSLPFFFPPS